MSMGYGEHRGGMRSANGMAYLLVVLLQQMIMDAGGPVYRRLDHAIMLSLAVRAMLSTDKASVEGQKRAEEERDRLYKIQEKYSPYVDREDTQFAKRPEYMLLINECMQNLMQLSYEYDLINPSMLSEVRANPWKQGGV